MTRLILTLDTAPAEVLSAVADVLRTVSDRLPILTACRMRVLAEDIAAEAIRLQEAGRV